jgi:hypothetical protein
VMELTSKITAEHQIKYEKAVLVVLEGVSQIHNEWVVDLHGRKRINSRVVNLTSSMVKRIKVIN